MFNFRDCRINTDWLWDNFPNERRFASMIFVADNILVPEVIQAIYRVRKSVETLVTSTGDSWQDMCMKVPIVKAPDVASFLNFGRKRRKRQDDDIGLDFGADFDEAFQKFSSDFSNDTSTRSPTTASTATTTTRAKTTTTTGVVTSSTRATSTSNSSSSFSSFDDDEDNFFSEAESDSGTLQKIADSSSSMSIGEYFSINSYPDPYCKIANEMPTVCLELGLLELWANDGHYDEQTDQEIADLTQESILSKINSFNKSGVFLVQKNFADYLGGISYDDRGRIIGARATVIRWLGKMNATEALLNPVVERNEPIDRRTLTFEGEMIAALLNTTGYPEGLESFPNAQRSFGDVAGSTILGDISYMTIGFMIVYAYVMLMLGKLSCVEQRVYLSIAGISGVVMGIVVSYGICSAVGLFFGPMHNVLPFLLLGIGIDDMFVIVQSWDTLSPKDQTLSLQDRFGKTLSHSGVAITITSITDVVAFAIGGTTVLPALKSFCLFASVGIVAIYWFQCTFFVAWMTLDQKRLESHRNGCCPCYQHKEYTPNAVAQRNISQSVFEAYGNLLMKTPTKITLLVVTLALTGLGIWGNILLEQRFDPTWFLPPESYLARWFQVNQQYFPFGGDRVTVWCTGLDYVNELERLDNLAKRLTEQTDIIDDVDSWTGHFIDYVKVSSPAGRFQGFPHLNESEFHSKLTQFLFSPRGGKYRPQFKFEEDPVCGEKAPKILLSDVTFTHKVFDGPSQHIPAMNRVKRIIREANLTGKIFPLSQGYASWETDEVISEELYRNIGLAILCIFVTTIVLVGNLVCSILVLIMVIISLVDVGGFMHFWGLTIDTVSCVNLIIAIGLCVDYSAHIAHRFLVEHSGSRTERVKRTLTNIGPAVMNGGISTFLAFILLANSRSHVFLTFFKIFFLVVVFGLFQGLVVLPIILSLVGPKPNSISSTPSESEEENVEQTHGLTTATKLNHQNEFIQEETKLDQLNSH